MLRPSPLEAAMVDDRSLSPDDFAIVARIAHAHAGIALQDNKRTLVSSRLAKLVREKGGTMASFVAAASNDPATREALIQALTTNHTKFFREQHHFQHFAQTVRPQLLGAVDRGRPVRLWSAGSSSGEEVYSLAMTLLGSDAVAARRITGGNVALLATDINRDVLRMGTEARYPRVARDDIPAALGKLWLRDEGDGVEIAEAARALVRFRWLNLIGQWPVRVKFDAIFCRNTMIYFDAPTTERLQCRLAEQLVPGGYLYIGHSERLIGKAVTMLENVGQTIFRRVMS